MMRASALAYRIATIAIRPRPKLAHLARGLALRPLQEVPCACTRDWRLFGHSSPLLA